ncbi:dUTP diphosphatase [Candidatus Woesebacteria bacterium]|nr:dUTP diphosphatase [Candidatus Woesebacteria bacterium]
MINEILVGIKRFDTTLPLPTYQTAGAAGIDLYARVETIIPARSTALVPLNIALQLPQGAWALLAARSSLHKKGLMMANGIGVGDSDYCGDGDEYRAALLNFSDMDVIVERGERIVQLIVMSYSQVRFSEKSHFTESDRGGFGTTGS